MMLNTCFIVKDHAISLILCFIKSVSQFIRKHLETMSHHAKLNKKGRIKVILLLITQRI